MVHSCLSLVSGVQNDTVIAVYINTSHSGKSSPHLTLGNAVLLPLPYAVLYVPGTMLSLPLSAPSPLWWTRRSPVAKLPLNAASLQTPWQHQPALQFSGAVWDSSLASDSPARGGQRAWVFERALLLITITGQCVYPPESQMPHV